MKIKNIDIKAEKLYKIQMYGRWFFVLLCWLILAPIGIWGLRDEISLIFDHFTWIAIIYGISYNFLPSLALTFSIAITIAVLVRQAKYKLTGISPRERQQLKLKIKKINDHGPSHPLWKWLFK